MEALAAFRKQVSQPTLENILRSLVDALVVQLNGFNHQVDRQTALVPIEILVQHLSQLLPRRHLTPVDHQIALQQVD